MTTRSIGRARRPVSRAAALASPVWLAAGLLAFSGCAVFGGAHHEVVGVPIEKRPTPKPPPPADTVAVERINVEPVVTEDQRAQLMKRVIADTTEAGAAVRRCAGRKLLPDQETVVEATINLLIEARAALLRDEPARAESLARKARQLSTSLRCP